MFQLKPLAASVQCALSILAIAVTATSAPTVGQAQEETLEEVVVTGTRIARRDFFSVSPIVTVDRTEIELTGATDLKNLLNDLPQVDPGVGAGTNNSPFGSARLNLRSLGDFRTLVLLNGRRYAANGIFGTVDLNSLPPVMIERVEIISGGASAVYGSDAIAGAVNFILRNDFDEFESSLQYDVTEKGDGDIYNFDIAYGTPFAGGRGNLALFGNYYERSTIFQDARGFSRTPLTSDDDTGEVISDASFVSPSGAIDGELGVDFFTFDTDGTPRLFVDPDDRYNTTSSDALRAPMERYSGNAFGHYDIGENVRMLFEFNYAHSAPKQRRGDVFAGFVDVNVDRPDITPALGNLLASQYDGDGDGVASIFLLRRFSTERGEAVRTNERDFYRALIGFESEFGTGWRWSADYSYTTTDRDMRVSNDISVSRIQQGLLVDPATGTCFDTSGGCVPVNPFGAGNISQAAVDFIALTGTGTDEDHSEQVVNATLSGAPLELWAGDLDIALGVEYRRDKISFTPSESILSGDSVFSVADVTSSGVISVKEAFAETRMPLLRDVKWARYLGLEAGVRLSDYNIIDKDLWTWKLGGEWQVTEGLRLRAMQQRAIRAPNAAELFQDSSFRGIFFGLGPFFDQCSASRDPVGNGLADLCIAQGIPADQIGIFEAGFFPSEVFFSSNAELQAEEADTITAGFVWQPQTVRGLSLSVDYFKIEIDNAGTVISPNDATTLCFITRDPNDQFCNTFSRGPSGDIATTLVTFVNAAVARNEGIDFALNYDWEMDALGLFGKGSSFDLSFLATYYLEAGVQASPLAPFLDCAGNFGPLCADFVFQGALPELRMTTRLSYRSGPFSASLRWLRIGEMTNSENEIRRINGRPPAVLAVPQVSATNYFDLTLQQDVGKHFDLSLGISNLFDEDPPFLGSANQDANTDPTTYDVLGRRFFLRIKVHY
jgi:iron complex outermembrane recepter protein